MVAHFTQVLESLWRERGREGEGKGEGGREGRREGGREKRRRQRGGEGAGIQEPISAAKKLALLPGTYGLLVYMQSQEANIQIKHVPERCE